MIQTASMVLRNGTRLLAKSLGDSATRDARLLMAHTLGVGADRLTLELSRMVTPTQVSQFEHMIKRRAAFEPMSHILGKRMFWGREFKVTPDVLDPRPETETLIDLALKGPTPERILDLGTGSGCILLTLLAEWPLAHGVGTDVSASALKVAAGNADMLGVADRLELRDSDWFADISGTFDLITCNPPYITEQEMAELAPDVRNFEPHLALTPGGDGLSAYSRIAKSLNDYLVPNGRAFFEIGYKQGADVVQIFEKAGFVVPQLHQDLNGHDRIIEIKK